MATILPHSSLASCRRQRPLVRLERKGLEQSWLARSGRWSAWYIAVTHCGLLLFIDSTSVQGDLSGVVVRAVTWVSWSAGLVALASATDTSGSEPHRAGLELARARGFSNGILEAGRTLAAIETTVRASLLPAVAVALLALVLSGTFAAGFASGLRLFAVAGYALLLGALLGSLSRFAVWLSPRHARWAFVGLVLGPYAVRPVFGDVPSVVSVLGGALERISAIAGGIG